MVALVGVGEGVGDGVGLGVGVTKVGGGGSSPPQALRPNAATLENIACANIFFVMLVFPSECRPVCNQYLASIVY